LAIIDPVFFCTVLLRARKPIALPVPFWSVLLEAALATYLLSVLDAIELPSLAWYSLVHQIPTQCGESRRAMSERSRGVVSGVVPVGRHRAYSFADFALVALVQRRLCRRIASPRETARGQHVRPLVCGRWWVVVSAPLGDVGGGRMGSLFHLWRQLFSSGTGRWRKWRLLVLAILSMRVRVAEIASLL
jgi:hypothetical protein